MQIRSRGHRRVGYYIFRGELNRTVFQSGFESGRTNFSTGNFSILGAYFCIVFIFV